MTASVPERCPQCHSPVAERFPHAVTYDCGLSLFNDGQPVTDDYPAECQRRRIKRLEKQLAAARTEAERWREKYEALKAGLEELIRHVRLVLPERAVRVAQAPVSRRGITPEDALRGGRAMSEPLTPERLAELRRIAEAAVPGKWSGQDFQLAMTPRTALALLDEIERLRREREEIVDSVTRFVLYDPDLNAWECQACRFWWEFEVGDPYEHDMRFCPRCGRRIVAEVRDVEDGEAEDGENDA